MRHKLVDFVSGNVDLSKSKLVVVFVIQNIHQICIKWMNILTNKQHSCNIDTNSLKIHTLLQNHYHHNYFLADCSINL